MELGASGVLLNLGVVGGDLETLLDAATIMGAEAMVEIHSPNELDYALSKGATLFLVNMWDRLTGKLYPDQVCMIGERFFHTRLIVLKFLVFRMLLFIG